MHPLLFSAHQVDPVKRFDTYQVLAHPWVSGKAPISNVNLSKSVSMNLKKHMGIDGKGSMAAALAEIEAEGKAPAPAAQAPVAQSSPAPSRGAKKTAV